MRSDRSQFEVRCPRCEVTFPIGTRTCVHCGGATVASADAPSMGEWAQPAFDFVPAFEGALDREPNSEAYDSVGASEYGVDSGFGSTSRFELDRDPNLEVERPARQVQNDAPETPRLARSILGSMGSLIWIVLLIAFSLSGRVCGE